MILECKSCQKKFIVPDNAITKAGRLVQCSSCGNQWTQFPVIEKIIKKPKNFQVKKEVIKKPVKIQTKIKEQKIFITTEKKKKIVKKKSGPSIYSKEYLEKKHGINIDGNNTHKEKNYSHKKISKSYFGFYSYLIILLFLVSSVIGILNLTKEVIIFYLPFTEIYIEYLFENLNYFGILFRDAFNIY
tara:strand:- start:353 stop:913 length:561 start_codon:yes stop_codon:yes gene_type:complete